MSYQEDIENMTTGKQDFTNFGALLLHLVLKADLHNRALLRKSYPNAVKVAEHWRATGEFLFLPYD